MFKWFKKILKIKIEQMPQQDPYRGCELQNNEKINFSLEEKFTKEVVSLAKSKLITNKKICPECNGTGLIKEGGHAMGCERYEFYSTYKNQEEKLYEFCMEYDTKINNKKGFCRHLAIHDESIKEMCRHWDMPVTK